MIRFKCPACQKVLKILDDGAGSKTTCPKCGQRMQVPGPTGLAQGAIHLPPSAPAPSLVVCAEDDEQKKRRPTGFVAVLVAGFLTVSTVLCCVVATVQDKPPLAQKSMSYQPEQRHKTETHLGEGAADKAETIDAIRQEAEKASPMLPNT